MQAQLRDITEKRGNVAHRTALEALFKALNGPQPNRTTMAR